MSGKINKEYKIQWKINLADTKARARQDANRPSEIERIARYGQGLVPLEQIHSGGHVLSCACRIITFLPPKKKSKRSIK